MTNSKNVFDEFRKKKSTKQSKSNKTTDSLMVRDEHCEINTNIKLKGGVVTKKPLGLLNPRKVIGFNIYVNVSPSFTKIKSIKVVLKTKNGNLSLSNASVGDNYYEVETKSIGLQKLRVSITVEYKISLTKSKSKKLTIEKRFTH